MSLETSENKPFVIELENIETKMSVSLSKKLAIFQKSLTNPRKSGLLKQYNFYYSNRDDIAAVIKPALQEANLAIFPSVISQSRERVKNGWLYMAKVKLKIIDLETGDFYETLTYAEALDASDKGLPKCLTSAIRHWAINTFWLSDGGEEGLYYESPDPTQPAQPSPQPNQYIERPRYNNQPRKQTIARRPSGNDLVNDEQARLTMWNVLINNKGFDKREAEEFIRVCFDKPPTIRKFDSMMKKIELVEKVALLESMQAKSRDKEANHDIKEEQVNSQSTQQPVQQTQESPVNKELENINEVSQDPSEYDYVPF